MSNINSYNGSIGNSTSSLNTAKIGNIVDFSYNRTVGSSSGNSGNGITSSITQITERISNYENQIDNFTSKRRQIQEDTMDLEEFIETETIKEYKEELVPFTTLTTEENNENKDGIAGIFQKGFNLLKKTGATISVATTSVVSGVLGFKESLIDGGAYLVSGTLGLVGLDNASNTVKEFIAVDLVGEANKLFYENTEIGRKLNDASIIKYNSELAQNVGNVTTMASEIAAATAVTIATGGAAAPAAYGAVFGIGVLSGAGSQAESTYQQGTDTTILQEVGVLGSGLLNGLTWMANGKLGSGAIDIAKDCSALGVKKVTSDIVSKTMTKDFALNVVKENLSLKNANGKANINAVANYVTSAFGASRSLTPYINGEEEFTASSALKVSGIYLGYLGANILEDVTRDRISGFKASQQITESISTIETRLIASKKELQVVDNIQDTYVDSSKLDTTESLVSPQIDDDLFDTAELFSKSKISQHEPEGGWPWYSEDTNTEKIINPFDKKIKPTTPSYQADEIEVLDDTYLLEKGEVVLPTEELRHDSGIDQNVMNKTSNIDEQRASILQSDYRKMFKTSEVLSYAEMRRLQQTIGYNNEEKLNIFKTYFQDNLGIDLDNISPEVMKVSFETPHGIDLNEMQVTYKNVCVKDIVGTTDKGGGRTGNLMEFELNYSLGNNSYYLRAIDGFKDHFDDDIYTVTEHMYENFDGKYIGMAQLVEDSNGKFYVGGDGNHRTEILRLRYAQEIAEAISPEEIEKINQKFTFRIPVMSKNIQENVDTIKKEIFFSTHEKRMISTRLNKSFKENIDFYRQELLNYASASQQQELERLFASDDLFEVVEKIEGTDELLIFDSILNKYFINLSSSKVNTISGIGLSNVIRNEILNTTIFNQVIKKPDGLDPIAELAFNEIIDSKANGTYMGSALNYMCTTGEFDTAIQTDSLNSLIAKRVGKVGIDGCNKRLAIIKKYAPELVEEKRIRFDNIVGSYLINDIIRLEIEPSAKINILNELYNITSGYERIYEDMVANKLYTIIKMNDLPEMDLYDENYDLKDLGTIIDEFKQRIDGKNLDTESISLLKSMLLPEGVTFCQQENSRILDLIDTLD